MEFAQYQVISIDNRRDFIPRVDHFPLRILGLAVLLPQLSFQLTNYDVTSFIAKKKKITSNISHLNAKKKAKVDVEAGSLLDTFYCCIKFTTY